MGKQLVVASRENIGLLIDRFRKFIKRNEEKGFNVKGAWIESLQKEIWKEGGPIKDVKFKQTPKVGKHYNFGINECLFSIQAQSIEDVVTIHYGGDREYFDKSHSSDFNLANCPINSFIIKEGDKVFFKNNGIMVIPKRKDSVVRKKRLLFFTA
jgi:hypothetical protein